MRSGRRAAKVIAVIAYIIVILVATPQAQQPVSFSGSPGGISAGPAAAPTDATSIDLLVGRSTILNVGSAISRVSLTVPDVADAMVTAPQQLLIHGKTPGTISLFVWDRAGGIKTYEVNVRRDLKQLIEQMTQLFPGEPITVAGSGKDVVLSGTVSSKYVIDKAADVAGGFVDKKENVVNLLKQQEGVASNQVMLRVRFAEVSRNAMQELGASFVLNGTRNNWFGRATTGQFPAPEWDEQGRLVFSDFLNLFVLNTKQGLGAVIKALSSKGLFQSLAEPNLIALNGKEASFLAGGEYPYPVVQPSSGGNSVTIQFKEFGIRLNFTPTVLNGDLINLKVRPEVSSLDFGNGLSLAGFRVPALSTRRTETEVELQDGQTFAIAGLMNNNVSSTMQKIPGIGDIPVLGYLFKSRAYQKNETELVVMITPSIVRRGSTGVSSGLPSIVEPYLGPNPKPMPQPAPYVGSPRYPVNPAQGTSPRGGDAQQPSAPSAMVPSAPAAPAPKTSAPQAAQQSAPPAASAAMPRIPVANPQPIVAQTETPAVTASPAPLAPKPDSKAAAREREDKKAAEAQRAADRKAAQEKAEADKKAAEHAAEEGRRKLEEKERQEKLDKERAKREAEVAKKSAEVDRKKQEEAKKQEKAVAEAAARLKEAQAAYQAQVDRKKGNQ
jgi:pilus assembly protein CpaC